MTPVNEPARSIVAKVLYIKMIFLTDQEKYGEHPVFNRKLRRSGEEFPVYDSSIFYQFIQFAPERPTDHEWRFSSSQGYVDALQLHPFDSSTFHADPAKRTIQRMTEGYLRPTPDTLLVVCHNYNGFQRGEGEWAGVRAPNDTALLRLVLDFSSVMTAEDEELFSSHPVAHWVHELERDPEKQKTPLEFEYDDGRVLSVSQKDVLKKDVLEVRYKLNWDALVNWQAYHENKAFVPEILF